MALWGIYVDSVKVMDFESGDMDTTCWGTFPQTVTALPEIVTALNGRPWVKRKVDGETLSMNILTVDE